MKVDTANGCRRQVPMALLLRHERGRMRLYELESRVERGVLVPLGRLTGMQLDSGEMFRALVPIPARTDEPKRSAMIAAEGSSVEMVGEHDVRLERILQSKHGPEPVGADEAEMGD